MAEADGKACKHFHMLELKQTFVKAMYQ